VRRISRFATIVTAVGALALAGCSGSGDGDEQATLSATEGELGSEQAAPEPSGNVEDGVYRGNGIQVPIPDGFELDPSAEAQGVVVASSADGTQQLSARAVNAAEAEAAGGEAIDLEALVDSVRQQVGGEADVDEEVEIDGADRAHRLTFTNLPGQGEGAPETSATVVFAQAGDLIAEFVFSASTDNYDDAIATQMVEGAGFDPDSEPPAMPAPPAPEGGGTETTQPDDEG
jgi:hypothetical protein